MDNIGEGLGMNISGLVRDVINAEVPGMSYAEAVRISEVVDKYLSEVEWVHSYNGTTFTKTLAFPGGNGYIRRDVGEWQAK